MEDRTTDLVLFLVLFYILPIDQLIFCKVFLLTHNSVHGTAPGYLKALLILDMDVVDAELSNTMTRSKRPGDHLMLKVPKNKKSKVDDRRFSSHAPIAWNSLPLMLRCITDTNCFKRMLKTIYIISFDVFSFHLSSLCKTVTHLLLFLPHSISCLDLYLSRIWLIRLLFLSLII